MSKTTKGPQVPFIFMPGFCQRYESPIVTYNGVTMAGVAHVAGAAGLKMTAVLPDWRKDSPAARLDRMVAAAVRVAGPGEPVILSGFSMGGATALQAAKALADTPNAPKPFGVVAASASPVFGGAHGEGDPYSAFQELF
jgi:hypothetical protein